MKVCQRTNTHTVNKLRLNMKVVMNPRIKKDQSISVHDSSKDKNELEIN